MTNEELEKMAEDLAVEVWDTSYLDAIPAILAAFIKIRDSAFNEGAASQFNVHVHMAKTRAFSLPSEEEFISWFKKEIASNPAADINKRFFKKVHEYFRSQIKTVQLKEWRGREFAEKTFPNIFERLQYVAEARHLNLDDAAYDAHEYLKELIKLACAHGLKPAQPISEKEREQDDLMRMIKAPSAAFDLIDGAKLSDEKLNELFDALVLVNSDLTISIFKFVWRAAEARILGGTK